MIILFNVLAMIAALLGVFLIGWIGVGLAAVFGALAIFFVIRRNKMVEEGGKKKIAGLIVGAVAIVLSFLTQMGLSSAAVSIKEQADEKQLYIVSAGAEGMKTLGFVGFISEAVKVKPADLTDDQFIDEMKKQFDQVTVGNAK